MAIIWTPNYEVAEEFANRQENWDAENPSVTVTLRCKFEDRYLVIADIVGNYRFYPFNTPVTLSAIRGTISLDRACKGTDTAGQAFTAGYDSLINVTYAYLKGATYVQNSDEDWPAFLYAEEDIEPSMEFLTIDFQKFAWAKLGPADLPIDPLYLKEQYELGKTLRRGEEPGKPNYEITISRTVQGYKTLPKGWEPTYDGTSGDLIGYSSVDFTEWIGKVHSKQYLSDFNGLAYEAGTLLFTDPQIQFGPYVIRYDLTNPSNPIAYGPSWRITAKLRYKEMGWNTFWRSFCESVGDPGQEVSKDTSGWFPMVDKGCKDGSGSYPTYLPYKSLDMTEFIFNGISYPPDPWPPEVPTP